MQVRMHGIYRHLIPLAGLWALLLGGCVSMATDRLAGNLAATMLNQQDPEIVRSGAPAYLLLIDSLIEDAPNDSKLLFAGARLYGAYGGGLIDDPQRRRSLAQKALDYAGRGLCRNQPAICGAQQRPYDKFVETLSTTARADLEGLYVFAVSWAGWIQANREDWGAIAELAKVEAVLQRVVELDPGYEKGRAQLYLGVIRSQVPPSLGGKPEIGRRHFERAIEFSQGRDLMAKVEFARRYARLVFNQALHDRLLQEVVAADPAAPGLTLSNILAQQQARELLADEYF